MSAPSILRFGVSSLRPLVRPPKIGASRPGASSSKSQVAKAIGRAITHLRGAASPLATRAWSAPRTSKSRIWFAKGPAKRDLWTSDTTLIPPGTQYGARRSNPKQRNPPRNGGFASPGNPLQRPMDHSYLEQVSGSSPLVGSPEIPRFAGKSWRSQKAPARRRGRSTATVLQPAQPKAISMALAVWSPMLGRKGE
jgi:hypothetical protein